MIKSFTQFINESYAPPVPTHVALVDVPENPGAKKFIRWKVKKGDLVTITPEAIAKGNKRDPKEVEAIIVTFEGRIQPEAKSIHIIKRSEWGMFRPLTKEDFESPLLKKVSTMTHSAKYGI